MSIREAELWAAHWAKPQSVIWEANYLVEEVALYVRMFAEAEQPKASAVNRTNVRLMMSDLFLTADSLAKAKYRIEKVEPEVPEYVEPQPEPAAPASPGSRDRFLRAVPDAGSSS